MDSLLSIQLTVSPSTFEAEQGKGADVFIHEIFPSAEEFAFYNHMPIQSAEGVMEEHTTPAELGRVYSIAKPRLGVGIALHAGRRSYRSALPALEHDLQRSSVADARPDNHQCHF